MQYYLFVLLAVIALAVSFCLTKLYQNRTGDALRTGVLFNILCGGMTAVIFLCIALLMDGNAFALTGFSALLAFLMAFFSGAYTVIGFRIMAHGSVAVYTLFLMLGGMMLPYFFGLIFLHEEFSVLRLIGLVLMVVSLILSANKTEGEKKKGSALFLILCVSVFLLNGGCSIVSKIHQLPQYAEKAVTSAQFVVLNSLAKIVLFAVLLVLLPLFRKRGQPRETANDAGKEKSIFRARILFLIFLIALAGGVSYLLQLIGASHLPATVLYPMVTGGSVILSTLAARIWFHEKISRKTAIGIGLCFLSTLFFL